MKSNSEWMWWNAFPRGETRDVGWYLRVQLLLSVLNEQCQVSNAGFFKVRLAQSAMNYWAWASTASVPLSPHLTLSFVPSRLLTVTHDSLNMQQYSATTIYWSPSENVLLWGSSPKGRSQGHTQTRRKSSRTRMWNYSFFFLNLWLERVFGLTV